MTPPTSFPTTSTRSDRFTTEEWGIIDAFHRLWYEKRAVGVSHWLDLCVLKTPMDLWSYQEVLTATEPDWLIETGTAWGGSALYFATIMDLLGHGQVCTVDAMTDIPALYRWAFGGRDDIMRYTNRPQHPRITYVTGDVRDPATVAKVRTMLPSDARVMVSLDSHHETWHVAQELELFAPLVTPGCYLVIEDTNMGGHPVQEGPWDSPYDAAVAFLGAHPEFALDYTMTERFLMSYNLWLLRKEE